MFNGLKAKGFILLVLLANCMFAEAKTLTTNDVDVVLNGVDALSIRFFGRKCADSGLRYVDESQVDIRRYAFDKLLAIPVDTNMFQAVNRQDFLEEALNWVSRGEIDAYMSQHRFDADITELKTYFETVLAWVQSVFPEVDSTMQGLAWGALYERHHSTPYDAAKLATRARTACG